MAFDRQEMHGRIVADRRSRTLGPRDAEALGQYMSTLDMFSAIAVRIGLLIMPAQRTERMAASRG
jgi:hypothetical protein